MNTKVLVSSTIIPPSLYVERDADRQLNRTIGDMQRPGYVLVARQMGKTNLLINMKRRRDGEGETVVYIDLSNRFKTARGLFRHIIDTIIAVLPDDDAFEARIASERHGAERQPNIEYDRHLRLIVKERVSTKLVIVLDEIDSLVNCSYSDTILAQVRSMYFSRVTYPEYDRLTYVLSGVAEPTDLIKDKSISPFNIGEKIYLDDFSLSEVETLVAKTGLVDVRKIASWIFSWTQGSPRMTWDVCSAVEDASLSGDLISQGLIETIVKGLYLNLFDRAPVDHIRVLVAGDPVMREAVGLIHAGRTSEVDERTRSRLYLSGITKSAVGAPSFKNVVIEAALSEQWLAEVDSSERSVLEAAAESFKDARYEDVLRLIARHAEDLGGVPLEPITLFQRGVANFYAELFDKSVDDLRAALSEGSPDLPRLWAKHILGASLIRLRRSTEAIPVLEEALEGPEERLTSSVRLTLSSAYLAENPKSNAKRASALLRSIIDGGMSALEDAASHEEIVALVRYNAAWAARELGRFEEFEEHIRIALAETSAAYRPALHQLVANLGRTLKIRNAAIKLAGRDVIDNQLTPSPKPSFGLALTERRLVAILSKLIEGEMIEQFDELWSYTSINVRGDRGSLSFILGVVPSTNRSDDLSEYASLLSWAAENLVDDGTVNAERFAVQRLRMYSASQKDRGRARLSFFESFAEKAEVEDFNDDNLVEIFSYVAGKAANPSPIVVSISDRVVALESQIRERDSVTFAVLMAQVVAISAAVSDFVRSEWAAQKVIDAVNEVERSDVDDQVRSLVMGMKSQAESHLRYRAEARRSSTLFPSHIDALRDIARNDLVRVFDSDTKLFYNRKFKLVERELRSGRFQLIEVVGRQR